MGATGVTDPVLGPGDAGEPVRDVQQRLSALGYDVAADQAGVYGPTTERAVRLFQERRGLRVDGRCGRQTWSSLVEAGYTLGDRFLYLRAPMLRGDDVQELQRLLGALGFDTGRIDGIFGPATEAALGEFQRNAGLTTDRICGPDTLETLQRLAARVGHDTTVARIREIVRLLGSPRRLLDRRLAVGETGGLSALADALGRALTDAGAVVTVVHHPDESTQASAANGFGADAFVALAGRGEFHCRVAYYAAEGFQSEGGRHLATLAAEALRAVPGASVEALAGMRLPILRETRMPAVLIEIAPPGLAVERGGDLASALAAAVARWVADPIDLTEF